MERTREEAALREAKKLLRRATRAAAERLTAEERERAGAAMAKRISTLAVYARARRILAFYGMAGEPDTRPILEMILRDGKTLLLPACPDTKRMEARRADPERLVPGRMNIPEPPTDAGTEEPDLVLLPCVAASRDGRRLGHGAGYYDRYLAGRRADRVILCMERFLTEALPAGELDIRGDLVVSEERTYGCGRS